MKTLQKPNKELAQAFIDSGEFVWNSGIYLESEINIEGF